MYNIGIDARFMLRPLRGIPLYVDRLCNHLHKVGNNFNFYLFINEKFEHNDKIENYQSRLDQISEHNNIYIVNCNHDAEVIWEQIYLPKLVNKYKIDILHMPANRMSFFSPCPVVVTVHDVMEYLYLKRRYFEFLGSGDGKRLRMILYKTRFALYAWINYRFALKKANAIITVSNYSADDINRYLGVDRRKIFPIHHGLDTEFIRYNTAPVMLKEHGHRYVLMFGGDSYQKNPEGAISSWAKVPEHIRKKFPLKVIGFCGGKDSPLVKAIAEHNLKEEVEIIGWVSQSEMIKFMKNASLFLYLSRYEGFGFPLLHAMSSGIPVISTNKTSIPEVLGGVGLQYEPDDHNGIATGIVKALEDLSWRNDQYLLGLKRANNFSWEKSALEHLNVYRGLLL